MESGRNNVITGVAKAINTHFRKNPLAIVNVKGRAKGTTVEEVVFELEVGILLESASLVCLLMMWLKLPFSYSSSYFSFFTASNRCCSSIPGAQ